MQPDRETSSERALNAFLQRFFADQASRTGRPLAEYQADFPEHAALIAEWHAIYENGESTQAAEPPLVETIGSYRIAKELGRGGQGIVYLAEDERLRRRAAVKVLTGLGSLAPERVARFLREAAVASRLNHPGIATVYEIGMDAGAPFIAMQYVEGEPLTATTRDRDVGRAVRIAEQTARALHAAHEAGVVHRDVKPGNILITPSGNPMIVDFGLAHDADPGLATITRSGEFFGTPAYMSPEQIAAGPSKPDRQTDVWSLGVTLYEQLAGRRPFEAATSEQLQRAILDQEPADLRRLNPQVSADLAAIVETALDKSLDRRYRTAAAMADDLAALRAGRPIAARRIGPVGRLKRWARREPALAALVSLLLVALPTFAALVASRAADRERLADATSVARAIAVREEKDELLAAAFYESGEGDPDAAIPLFQQALAFEGGSPEAAVGLAAVHLKRKRQKEALAVLDANAAVLDGIRAPALLRAAALRGLGRVEEGDVLAAHAPPRRNAVDDYLDAERLIEEGHAGHADAYREALSRGRSAVYLSSVPRSVFFQCVAHAATHVGDVQAAREMAEALRRHWPRSAACTRRAGLALLLESPDDGIALLREAVRLNPAYLDGYLSLGISLRERGSFAEALTELETAVKLGPGNPAAHAEVGITLNRLGRVDDSLAAFREAVRLKPSYADARRNVGFALKQKGQIDEAITELLEAVRLDPSCAQSHNSLGAAWMEKGRVEDAIAAFQNAVACDSRHAQAVDNLATTLAANGRHEEEIDVARGAIASDPGRAAPYFFLGNGLTAVGRFGDAVAAYREAIRIDPGYAEAHCNLSRPLLELGRLAEAVEAVKKGHKLGQKRADWTYPSARWVAHLEEMVAKEQRMLAVAAGRDEPEGTADLFELADLAGRTRRWDLAVTWYREAFDSDPALVEPGEPWTLKAARAAIESAFPSPTAPRPSKLTDPSRLRALALEWLRRGLQNHRKIAATHAARAERSRAAIALWIADPVLAAVRTEEDLARLPKEEAEAWAALWADAREAATSR